MERGLVSSIGVGMGHTSCGKQGAGGGVRRAEYRGRAKFGRT